MRKTLLSLLVGVLAAGCGDSGGGTDGGGGTGGVTPPPLSKGSAANSMAADYGCNHHFADPTPAPAEFTVNGKVTDFQSKNPVPGAVIKLYGDLATLLSDTPYDMKTCANDGTFTALKIPANHSRVNFKISAPPDQIDTYEVNIPMPAGTTSTDRNSVSHFTANALPGLVGIDYDPSKAVVAGGVRDCKTPTGDFVRGALIAVTAGGSMVPDSQVFYFSDQDLPVRKTLQQYTNYDGLFTVVNVPPSGMATITASGVITSGAVQKIGEMSIPLFAGTLTISDIPPLAQ